MGLKRIVARVELTYPANDPRTLEELRVATPEAVGRALAREYGAAGPLLAAYGHLNASVDPDPEPELPVEPDPREQMG